MLINKKGDLLKSDCNVIMHQANCFSTMGSGIAKSIAKLYPEAKKADNGYLGEPQERHGKFSMATVDGVTIANLYGQYDFGSHLKNDKIQLEKNYKMLEQAMDSFFTFAKNLNQKDAKINLNKVGVPYKMGSDRAGGNWEVIKQILERQSEKHEIDIYIYEL